MLDHDTPKCFKYEHDVAITTTMYGMQGTPARIRDAVEASGKTHAEVASALGLHRTAVTNRLAGRTRWSVDDVLALTDLLGVRLSDLIEGS